MFPRDPFNDPFFRDPFQHMNNMMNHMLNDPFFASPFGAFPQTQHVPRNAPPQIEEIPHEEHAARPHSHAGGSGTDPIVEEPDDVEDSHHPARPPRHSAGTTSRSAAPELALAQPFGGGVFGSVFSNPPQGATVYSYSSSSISSGGPGGMTYSSSTTTRAGPNRVRETQKTVRDGRTGKESITVARGLGDKERVVIRTRDASGSEHIEDILRGIDAHHAPQFDEQWRQQAEHVLPDVGPRTRRRLEPADPYPRQQQQQQYALPHNPGAAYPGTQQQQQGYHGGYGQQQQQSNLYQQQPVQGYGQYQHQQQHQGHPSVPSTASQQQYYQNGHASRNWQH
eukprot:jgi/Chrzof1/3339/Cz12g21130.t1